MSNGTISRRSIAWFAGCLFGTASVTAARTAQAADLVFLSTQLRPIEEAQKLRNDVLDKAPVASTFVPETTPQFTVRAKAEMAAGTHTISLLGALHGELQPLATLGALAPLDALATKLGARGFPDNLMELGRLGGPHQLYIPWMQATYVMVANKKALPFLPPGADIKTLTYAQLAAWAQAIQAKTGNRVLGFPAGPTGLMPRFFEGYLYPSFTGGVVTSFRTPAAEAMWADFATLWKSVTPNSTNYNFMQEPLLTGEVWIAWDHVARIQEALRQRPDDFVVFPAPAGPKGRGYMPVIAGLAITKGAPDPDGAAALIEYLTQPATQIQTLRSSSFFPTVKATIPGDLDAGLKLTEVGIAQMQSASDAKPSLLPVGLGDKGGAFDKVFLDTFQLIVLRGEKPHDVLPREGEVMQRIMNDTAAPCWTPDAPSVGACKVQ